MCNILQAVCAGKLYSGCFVQANNVPSPHALFRDSTIETYFTPHPQFCPRLGGQFTPALPALPRPTPPRLALLTLTSNGFARSADTGAGLALALFVIASNTSYTTSAYNMTGFASYLYVPYHDVVGGTQSVPAFLSVTVLLCLFHSALATVLALPMFFIMGIDGPPLVFPTFVAGVSMWVLGVFGFITLVMGLDTLVSSCLTSRIMHADELTARRNQQPVS